MTTATEDRDVAVAVLGAFLHKVERLGPDDSLTLAEQLYDAGWRKPDVTPETVGPSKGAGRPSCLAMNPRNREASAERRARLLEAFSALGVGTQADFLEFAEEMAYQASGTIDSAGDGARAILRRIYAAAGLE